MITVLLVALSLVFFFVWRWSADFLKPGVTFYFGLALWLLWLGTFGFVYFWR